MLRRQLPREESKDYMLADWNGGKTALSSAFGDKDDLIVIHNMGRKCVYCTLWADGFIGLTGHFENRAGFVVISPDDPEIQREFAESRGWKFKMLSGKGTTFIKDMGFETDDGHVLPGYSTFYRENGKIYRVAHDFFGPGDDYCSIWHMIELLANGSNGWEPQYKY